MAWWDKDLWSNKRKKKKKGIPDEWVTSPFEDQYVKKQMRELDKIRAEYEKNMAARNYSNNPFAPFLDVDYGEPEPEQAPEPKKVDIGTALDYEEPEEAEFDEDCVPGCLPGAHKCGK